MCDNVVGDMKVATDLHDNEGKKLVQGKSKDPGQNMAEAWRTFVAADTSRAFFLRNSLNCRWDSTLRYQFLVDRTRETFNPIKCSFHDLTFVFES